MPGNLAAQNTKQYLRIVGGNIVRTVDKNTEGARLREYELPNGEKGEKWELVYMNWTGKIQNIQFKDGEYGTSCMIDLGDAVLTLNTESRYFQDLACKLFSADLTQEIIFHPYDIEGQDGKKKTGVSLKQDGEKLKNFFYDFDEKKSLHGFPEPDKTKKTKKTYWKIYFAEVAQFLMEKIDTLQIPTAQTKDVKDVEEPAEEVALEDLPF